MERMNKLKLEVIREGVEVMCVMKRDDVWRLLPLVLADRQTVSLGLRQGENYLNDLDDAMRERTQNDLLIIQLSLIHCNFSFFFFFIQGNFQ